ncbi:MAG: heme A synthase [Azospirillum sp.]|nr:heme A synthase [Azospirillum sp.]
MVFAMAVIGAITRLTESGLSMVEWKPLIGILPPLSEAEWQRVFGLYQQSPEYRLHNAGMTLEAFRGIFWWEWFHRLWGQMIGFVFALPLLWFALQGQISRRLMPRLIGLFVLGGLQGAVGWFMVMSGLVERPSVSHYRLAMHLVMAILIFGVLLWTALDLIAERLGTVRAGSPRGLSLHAGVALALALTTVVWGAFVAGLDAGQVYNTFPLMNGRLLPEEAWTIVPAWLNVFENTALVQFLHRWLAITTLVVVQLLWLRAGGAGLVRRNWLAVDLLAAMSVLQVGLGVATLLKAVPVALAAGHQAGALTLIGLLVWTLHEMQERPSSGGLPVLTKGAAS